MLKAATACRWQQQSAAMDVTMQAGVDMIATRAGVLSGRAHCFRRRVGGSSPARWPPTVVDSGFLGDPRGDRVGPFRGSSTDCRLFSTASAGGWEKGHSDGHGDGHYLYRLF